MKTSRILFLLGVLNFFGALSTRAVAQSAEYSCQFFFHLHQGVDCLEALFSEDPVHLIVGSVPPGNGFAIGAIAEKPTHFVSPFAPKVIPDVRDQKVFPSPIDPDTKQKIDRGGYKSLLVPRVGAAISANGSWYAGGTLDWLPGIYKDGVRTTAPTRPGLPRQKKTCHELFVLCTEAVLAIHLEATHRVAQTINFFGLGPGSPPAKSVFRFDETYTGVQARMPLTDVFTLAAGVEGRIPDLPIEPGPNSVFTNFPPASLTGFNSQPTYVHSQVGLITQTHHVYEAATKENDNPNAHVPFLKHRVALSTNGDFVYHWYNDTSGNSSFQQLMADADLSLELGAVTQRYVISTSVSGFLPRTFYRILQHYCGGPPADPRTVMSKEADAKARAEEGRKEKEERQKNHVSFEIKHDDNCDFGTLNLRSHLVTSAAATGNVIPFYMLPTVGGQDIDSRISLRGFDNYRFRGPDATFVQADYTLPVYDPFGLLVFYDAGNAGNVVGDLSFAHLREDGGFGINIRILRMSVAQLYVAEGSGGGLHPGFSLVKQF